MEVALDNVAVLFAFRQSAWPMGTGVVDDVESIVDLEDGEVVVKPESGSNPGLN